MMPLLLWFAAFLGLPAGYIISHMAKEELSSGRRYFIIMRKTLVCVAFAVFQYIFYPNIIFAAATVAIMYSVLDFTEWIHHIGKVYYLAMTAMMLFSFGTDMAPILAGLVFLYGIVIASLYSADRLNKKS